MKRIARLAGLLCVATTHASAQDRADVDRTQIIGNRELPKVLYIVPWKKPQPGGLSGRPVQSVLDEALAPVDREVFRRQVDYAGQVHQQLQAQAAARAGTSALAVQPSLNPRQPAPTGESR